MSNRSDRSAAAAESARGQEPADDGTCAALESDPAAIHATVVALSSPQRTERTAAIFSALADPTRIRILEALGMRELCVCDLAEIAGISQSGVSHQLRTLRDLGLVAFRREGNRAVYRLADLHVHTLLEQGLAHADEGLDSR
jgi:ArsR family transcriptional regulator, lead/cadmium/zinc/bismuth-responsive transcriptional repressor